MFLFSIIGAVLKTLGVSLVATAVPLTVVVTTVAITQPEMIREIANAIGV